MQIIALLSKIQLGNNHFLDLPHPNCAETPCYQLLPQNAVTKALFRKPRLDYLFLLNFILFQIIYRRKQVDKQSSLSYCQAQVKIDLFCTCISSGKLEICRVLRPVS